MSLWKAGACLEGQSLNSGKVRVVKAVTSRVVKAVTSSVVLHWELGVGAKDLPNFWAKGGTKCVVRFIIKKQSHEAAPPLRRTPDGCCYCFLCV